MEIKGKPTIQPWLFYTGKTAGYITWGFFALSLNNVVIPRFFHSRLTDILTCLFFFAGIVIIILSLVNLGGSVRLGLPTGKTILKTGGIYQFSRNPMYIGLHLLTLAAMVYTFHPVVLIPGIFSFAVYHLIILGEERFLTERFGDAYRSYRVKVRRYL